MDKNANTFFAGGRISYLQRFKSLFNGRLKNKLNNAVAGKNTIWKVYYENTQDAVIIIAKNGNCSAANPAAESLFGMKDDEIRTTGYFGLISAHDDDADVFFGKVKEKWTADARTEGRLLFKRKDGSAFAGKIVSVIFEDEGRELQSMMMIRDQTDLISGQNKIREAEERNRQIVELAQEGIWVIDENNVTTFVNKAMCLMLDYEEKEMLGQSLFHFMNEEGRQISAANIERRKLGIQEQHDFVFQKKDGAAVWAILSTTPIFKEGRYAGAIALITDITRRKITEEKINQSEEKFRVLLENNYDAILLLDENLLTIYRSPATARIMGFTDEERIGKSYLELTHPDDVDKIKGFQQIVLHNPGISIPITVRALHSNGHFLWFEGNATSLLHKKSVGAIVVNLRDISERKKTEDAMLELTNRLQIATRAATLGIWEWNLVTNELKWDEAMYGLYGINPINFQLSYHQWTDLVYPEDLPALVEEVQLAIQGTKDFNTEFRIKTTGDRPLKYVRAMALTVRDEKTGASHKMIGCNWDNTDQKVASQEKEKLLADLTKRNQDLEQFAYIISHNLRAPVANVMSLNDMLLSNDVDRESEPEILRGLNLSVKRIDQIINDLNNIFQSKQQTTAFKEAVYFEGVINDIKQSIINIIVAENVEINCNFSEIDHLFTVRGYLYSIFYNLISNAIKYRKTNSSPVINIYSKLLDHHIEIAVKDNGKGIDLKRNSAMLFGLYQRFDTSVEGKGMGLYMVKTQVEALGGSITVESKPGEGTVFTIQFLR
jgi:PAS domain S-box-containing protein